MSALQGVFRALDSGPLEAWFIDASIAADRDVDIERGLSRQNVVICTSIGLGAMLGGLIGSTDGVFDVNPLVVPIALGLVLQVVGLVAIITLMHEVRAGQRLGRGPAVDRDGARRGPRGGAADPRPARCSPRSSSPSSCGASA